ncbi:hypothetical protein BGZ61DRAFT_485859 [Ilyonectria robusta]|uniref:uncharacterized protein n=1 Tax=Ilyonectria robusta TaxID=1079257 RepID=UPI001E8E0B3A|nr:uncharacterized protein BGZ61DRAFT_485859 [Ilyonectria robusta]KAH8659404.1 hypothetical protein BGZ61DRAFT_485859 [Ilyonectria robusta]
MPSHNAYCTACFHHLQPDLPQWRFPNSKLLTSPKLYCKKYIGSMIQQYHWNECMICWKTKDLAFFDCGKARKRHLSTGADMIKAMVLVRRAGLSIVSLDTPDPVRHGQTHRRSGCDHEISPGVLSPDQSQLDRSTANSSEFLTHESTSTQVPGQLHRASTTIIRNQEFIDLTLVDDDPSSMGSLTRKERKPTNTEFSTYTNRGGLSRRKRTRRVRGTVAVKDIIVID